DLVEQRERGVSRCLGRVRARTAADDDRGGLDRLVLRAAAQLSVGAGQRRVVTLRRYPDRDQVIGADRWPSVADRHARPDSVTDLADQPVQRLRDRAAHRTTGPRLFGCNLCVTVFGMKNPRRRLPCRLASRLAPPKSSLAPPSNAL